MSDVEIISSATCPFAQRTRMALIEKGIDFDLTAIDLSDKPDWFLKISPYGKVPVLRHDGAVIFESAVINEYLEEVFPERPLLPREPGPPGPGAHLDRLRQCPFHAACLQTDAGAGGRCPGISGGTAHQRASDDGARGAGQAGGRILLAGDDISLVDLTFLPHMQRLGVLAHYRDFQTPEECVLLKGWLQLMSQRPSVMEGSASLDVLIENWRKYAENTSTGTTADDMRAA